VKKVLKAAKLEPKDVEDIVLVGGSTRIPKVQQLLKEFFGGKEPNRGINPDEAVAYGATVQAGVLTGESTLENKVLLVDVTSLSVGIETVGGVMSVIIPRNTPVPAKKSKVVSTNADNQDRLLIQVYEGERAKTKDNRMLGKFELVGIEPAPRGKPKIEISFEIDENGILEVQAKDKQSGKKEMITISKDKGSLSQEDIDRMIAEAEKFEDEDKALRARIDERNALETFAYNLRQQITDESRLGEKMSQDDKDVIDKAVQEILEWLDANSDPDAEASREKYKFLESTCKPLIEKVYHANAEEHREKAKAEAEAAKSGEEGEGEPTDEL
jgi:heat shock protein 5